MPAFFHGNRARSAPLYSPARMGPAGKPKLLLLGPSGAGKSTLAEALAKQGWLHIDLDQWELDGLAIHKLDRQWEALSHRRDPIPLSTELSKRLDAGSHAGVVLSFPSGVVFGIELLKRVKESGLAIAILYGSATDCFAAFARREAAMARDLDRGHWEANSIDNLRVYSRPEFDAFRVHAFRDGFHRPLDELAAELISRCPSEP